MSTEMNVDKFGHHVHKRLRISEYIDILNETLTKTEEGKYDLKSSRLTGLLQPEDDDEAVNKAYLDKEIIFLKEEIKKSSRLKGLLHPKKDDDAVSKAHLDKEILELKEEIEKLQSKRLLNPKEDDDAVDKTYLDTEIQELKKDIKQTNSDLKNCIYNLQLLSTNLNYEYYTKHEVDRIIVAKTTKNE